MGGLGFAAELVDGALCDPWESLERPIDACAGADEQRIDDVVEVEARLADQRAKRRRAPEAAQARKRKGRHVARNLRTETDTSVVRRPWHGGRTASHAARPVMPVGQELYDHEHEAPATRGNVIDLWGVEEDWEFPTHGALALKPEPVAPETGPEDEPGPETERRFGLKALATFVTVPRMAMTEAPGFAARARQRQRDEARAKARRARRTAALVVIACGCLVALLLTAFGRGGETAVTITGPAPASRLLPAGPPRPEIVATQDSLRIQLPVNQSRVTALGYHASGTLALPLEPVGTQANAGLAERLFRRLFGTSGSGVRYYMLDGGVGVDTGGLDVGAPVDTDVYAPVDGSVIAITDNVVNGQIYGVRIDIQPSGSPGVVVSLSNLRADPALTVGSTVSSGTTKIGRVIDLSDVERAGLARYTQDNGQHVHIEVQPATALTSP